MFACLPSALFDPIKPSLSQPHSPATVCQAVSCNGDWAGQHYAGRIGLGADICPRRLDLFKRSGTPPSLSSSLFVSPSIYNPLPSTHTYLLHVRCSKANTCSSQLAPAF